MTPPHDNLDTQHASPAHDCARLLVVGGEEFAARLSRVVGESVQRCPAVYDAIGHVVLGAPGTVRSIVFEDGSLNGASGSAVATLRSIDSNIRLVRSSRDGAAIVGDSASEGFDATIGMHDSDSAVRAEVLGLPPEPANPPASAESSPARASAPKAILGDTDLVEAILDPFGKVPETAMALLRQHGAPGDIRFVDQASSADAVAVEWNGDRHGYLEGSAGAAELTAWAGWLARWLSLERHCGRLRVMSYTDELTGAWNRRYFEDFLETTLARAREQRRAVTLMVFDIDDFKRYNDDFGHDAGDEVLRETVSLLNSVIRRGDKVCRIGGDEFVVVFADPEGPREAGSSPPTTVEQVARRFQAQVCGMRFPKLGVEAPGALSISAGLATFPWDGADSKSLLRHADQLAIASKRKGKNAITFGPGAARACCEEAPNEAAGDAANPPS